MNPNKKMPFNQFSPSTGIHIVTPFKTPLIIPSQTPPHAYSTTPWQLSLIRKSILPSHSWKVLIFCGDQNSLLFVTLLHLPLHHAAPPYSYSLNQHTSTPYLWKVLHIHFSTSVWWECPLSSIHLWWNTISCHPRANWVSHTKSD